ncbi:MAG: hypothetical protein LBP39_01335 [Rickettsiales bacterium]|jgi:hypothetical protein|nr:hypothetical protein [Rickettsiales bacterium]
MKPRFKIFVYFACCLLFNFYRYAAANTGEASSDEPVLAGNSSKNISGNKVETTLDDLLDKCPDNFCTIDYATAEAASALKNTGKNALEKIRAGDLIFQVAIDSEFDDAVAQSGTTDNSVTHVGIFYSPDVVIEANDFGVVETNICKFIGNSARNIVMRIKNEAIISNALEHAKSFVGRPYNKSFYPNSEGLYCSELVTESFRNFNGTSYFVLYPMKFPAKEFWTEYYDELKLPIPEGVLGSHPQQILEQKELISKVVEIYCKKNYNITD